MKEIQVIEYSTYIVAYNAFYNQTNDLNGSKTIKCKRLPSSVVDNATSIFDFFFIFAMSKRKSYYFQLEIQQKPYNYQIWLVVIHEFPFTFPYHLAEDTYLTIRFICIMTLSTRNEIQLTRNTFHCHKPNCFFNIICILNYLQNVSI